VKYDRERGLSDMAGTIILVYLSISRETVPCRRTADTGMVFLIPDSMHLVFFINLIWVKTCLSCPNLLKKPPKMSEVTFQDRKRIEDVHDLEDVT